MAQIIKLDTAQRVDIVCRKGDTFDLSLTIKDSDSNNSTVYKNDSFKMEVRVSDDSNTAYGSGAGDTNNNIVLSTQDESSGATKKIDVKDSIGNAIPDPILDEVITDGIVRFFVTPAIMATRPAGLYVYDIEMTDASDDDKVTTLIYGTFKINEDVSI